MPQRLAPIIGIVIAFALAGCSPREVADLGHKMERWPGQRLGGTEQPVPANFDEVGLHDLVQLKVSGGLLPHVVNIWAVHMDDAIYVWTIPGTSWSQKVVEDPDVWVRVGDNVYPLTATKVSDDGERQQVFDVFMGKYGQEITRRLFKGTTPTVEMFELFYRLTARS